MGEVFRLQAGKDAILQILQELVARDLLPPEAAPIVESYGRREALCLEKLLAKLDEYETPEIAEFMEAIRRAARG